MRRSARDKPLNAFIHSIQLDKVTHDKLLALTKQTGLSKSHIVRLMLVSASADRFVGVHSDADRKAKDTTG